MSPAWLRFALSVAVALTVTLSGCSKLVRTRDEFTERLHARIKKPKMDINILWYMGTENGFHYFAHVTSMTSSKDYRVPVNELNVSEKFPYTSDSSKWRYVGSIGKAWEASRNPLGNWEPRHVSGEISIP